MYLLILPLGGDRDPLDRCAWTLEDHARLLVSYLELRYKHYYLSWSNQQGSAFSIMPSNMVSPPFLLNPCPTSHILAHLATIKIVVETILL